jgi:hypothetical protein
MQYASEEDLVAEHGLELIPTPLMLAPIEVLELPKRWAGPGPSLQYLIVARNGTYKYSSKCCSSVADAYARWKDVVSKWKP